MTDSMGGGSARSGMAAALAVWTDLKKSDPCCCRGDPLSCSLPNAVDCAILSPPLGLGSGYLVRLVADQATASGEEIVIAY
jgi:hypothetical protein